MDATRKYLCFSGGLIILLGFFYGAPKPVIESAFGIAIDNHALHIVRAIMGLYWGIGFMVLLGAIKTEYSRFSLQLQAIFFSGIGFGRLISFAIDGNANTVSIFATACEMLLFIICMAVLYNYHKRPDAQ